MDVNLGVNGPDLGMNFGEGDAYLTGGEGVKDFFFTLHCCILCFSCALLVCFRGRWRVKGPRMFMWRWSPPTQLGMRG